MISSLGKGVLGTGVTYFMQYLDQNGYQQFANYKLSSQKEFAQNLDIDNYKKKQNTMQ